MRLRRLAPLLAATAVTLAAACGPPAPPGPDIAANMRLGQDLAAEYGWTGPEWECLDRLWGELESGWDQYADNPHSDAYGIPQALPGSKMGPGWEHDPWVQIAWGLGYIEARYGSPCGALHVRLTRGWY